ncbi:assimilatory sulfite reductase (NADPH) flavoprotein subunit [Pusillimonas sp. TS35]|uniref:assimilatory sulfite reductase (NADPH) flavoprotein subunit n=1 Tax=Paracandidimonas lactea TaxID=2895524 RepID=UPI0013722C83|nr:assimilatory sulfite reductase (NADPH) flavoprotein subunit [Paracandidimonas lactea]MYN13333.1 assimilatory sulfite reductase (NADPH) flavoprotein subunit [Pusillimonas sp. TS35]
MLAPTLLNESTQLAVADLAQGLDTDALTWLSGYFAGVARARTQPAAAISTAAQPPVAPVAEAAGDRQITILYGSQTGNAKRVAEALLQRLHAENLSARLVRADRYATRELKDEHYLYVVMSTQGDGEPPDDSLAFVEFLNSRRAPKLPQLKYAVLGLGDSSYPDFCGISQRIDARLEALGAQRIREAGAADLDIDTVAAPWREDVLAYARKELDRNGAARQARAGTVTPLRPKAPTVTREQPFLAEVLLNQPITGRDSDKDIRHIEISLAGSHLSYQPGDALGVWPKQSDELVERVLQTLALDGAEDVAINGARRTLREWLQGHRELTQITRPFLVALAARAGSDSLDALLRPEGAQELRALFESRQLIDVLRAWPAAWTAEELVQALRPLAPRMYSIASSQSAVDDEVHLTLAHVAYEQDGEQRWGVASHFLSTLEEGSQVPVFVEENSRFRLPEDGNRDVIMIGPGTGVAPFRAFVQERAAAGAAGRNWLFFGNPHFASDFLYQLEWQRALADGELHRMDVAFSRDQAGKVYVQDRMLEHAAELYEWIENGAHVYVCGDATRMARDVQDALLRIARQEGALDDDAARAWLDNLAAQGRYARDVY